MLYYSVRALMEWAGFPGGRIPPHSNRFPDTQRHMDRMLARQERQAEESESEEHGNVEERAEAAHSLLLGLSQEREANLQRRREAQVLAEGVAAVEVPGPVWEQNREGRQRLEARRAAIRQERRESRHMTDDQTRTYAQRRLGRGH